MGHPGMFAPSQAKKARISPQRHGDTKKKSMRFTRCLNGHQREAPKIPASPCLRASVVKCPWLACSLQCATPDGRCRACPPMQASGAINNSRTTLKTQVQALACNPMVATGRGGGASPPDTQATPIRNNMRAGQPSRRTVTASAPDDRYRGGRIRPASRSRPPPHRPRRARQPACPGGADRQHPSAGGTNVPIGVRRRSGMEHLHVRHRGGALQAAGSRCRAPARQGSRAPPSPRRSPRCRANRRSKCASSPSHAACSAGSRSDRSRSSSTWHSGSPKRTLNSISFGPSAVSIRPAIQDAAERRAAARHLRQRRPDDALERRLLQPPAENVGVGA